MKACRLFLCFVLTGLASTEAHAAPPRPEAVPKDLAPILIASEQVLSGGEPERALRILREWTGAPHPLHLTLVGSAYFDLERLEEAEVLFRQALKLAPELRQAKVGLARVLVDTERWEEAKALVAELVDVQTSPASELGLYAQVAFEDRDLRLAALLAERGVLRFPQDSRFRQLDLAVLVERGAFAEAREAALSLLADEPGNAIVWRQLAAATDRLSAAPELRLATIEAAMLASPDDVQLVRRHAFAQLGAGHTQAALRSLRPLVESHPGDGVLVDAGVRMARAVGELDLARRWLDSVPTSSRSASLILLEAQVAIDRGEPKRAKDALTLLIDAGDGTVLTFLWAGRLAEQTGELVQAEVMYREAVSYDDPSRPLAQLYLARLLSKTHREAEAVALLRDYLLKHPNDETARILLDALEERGH
ncbi:MAG: tetratricopeptide repeat protein [Myxococcota bacterium]